MPGGRPAIVEPGPVVLADTELLARLFRTLGDATRLRLLELLLEDGELHQMELVRRLGATQARVSEHMSCLVWCGFVQRRTEGRRTLYRVEDCRVRALVDQARRSWRPTRPRSPAAAASTPLLRRADDQGARRPRSHDRRAMGGHR